MKKLTFCTFVTLALSTVHQAYGNDQEIDRFLMQAVSPWNYHAVKPALASLSHDARNIFMDQCRQLLPQTQRSSHPSSFAPVKTAPQPTHREAHLSKDTLFALLDIRDDQKRQSLITLAVRLVSPTAYDPSYDLILSALKMIRKPQQQEAIVSLLESLPNFNRNWDDPGTASLIKVLSQMPLEQGQSLLGLTNELHGGSKNNAARANLLEALRSVKEDDQIEIVHHLNRLQLWFLKEDEVGSFIFGLNAVSREHRPQLVRAVTPVLKLADRSRTEDSLDEMGTRLPVFKLFLTMKPAEWHVFSESALKLNKGPDGTDAFRWLAAIKKLAGLAPQDREAEILGYNTSFKELWSMKARYRVTLDKVGAAREKMMLYVWAYLKIRGFQGRTYRGFSVLDALTGLHTAQISPAVEAANSMTDQSDSEVIAAIRGIAK